MEKFQGVIKIWNEPTLNELLKIPPLYSTENTSAKDVMIYEHFFLFGSDWYIAEYDPCEQLMFGFAILNNDYQNAEWGYMYYPELRDLKVKGFEVDRDMHWKIKKAGEIERLVKSGGV